jgi:hypothetical protein
MALYAREGYYTCICVEFYTVHATDQPHARDCDLPGASHLGGPAGPLGVAGGRSLQTATRPPGPTWGRCRGWAHWEAKPRTSGAVWLAVVTPGHHRPEPARNGPSGVGEGLARRQRRAAARLRAAPLAFQTPPPVP